MKVKTLHEKLGRLIKEGYGLDEVYVRSFAITGFEKTGTVRESVEVSPDYKHVCLQSKRYAEYLKSPDCEE